MWIRPYFRSRNQSKMIMKQKRAQEEIVGFVAIVLLVVIALVIFLGISLYKNKTSSTTESTDLYDFLSSITEYTTDCAITYEPAYLKLGELIQECSSGSSICVSGKKPCDVSLQTLSVLINSSFLISQEASTKGYEFKAIDSNNKESLSLTKGNCTGSITSSEILPPGFPGTISVSLKLCS